MDILLIVALSLDNIKVWINEKIAMKESFTEPEEMKWSVSRAEVKEFTMDMLAKDVEETEPVVVNETEPLVTEDAVPCKHEDTPKDNEWLIYG